MDKFELIAIFGKKYKEKHLGQWDKNLIENNWWYALQFFFSHAFMRGRRDELSNEYYWFAIESLKYFLSLNPNTLSRASNALFNNKACYDKSIILDFKKQHNLGRKNSLKHEMFEREVSNKNSLISLLTTKREVNVMWNSKSYQKDVYLGNEEDVMLVLDTLKLISRDQSPLNVILWLKKLIVSEGVTKAYQELIKLRAVKDKIASFTIRDILLMNPKITVTDANICFPVDTWVKQIANKLGCSSDNPEEIKKYFIDTCTMKKLSPLKINAGIWYIGFNSLEILLDNLDKIANLTPNQRLK
jgi:hypothetical protein